MVANSSIFYLQSVSEARMVGSSYPGFFLVSFKQKQPLIARIIPITIKCETTQKSAYANPAFKYMSCHIQGKNTSI